jgi:DNA (cytosine-5)-methyltransferase 1
MTPVTATGTGAKTSKVEVKTKVRFSVISLFTGAGGLDLGLHMAGYNTHVCIEIDPTFRETLKLNYSNWNPIDHFGGDITKISSDLILEEAGLMPGTVDLIAGGPPCQSFSNMGNRKGVKDQRGQLFKDFVRIISEILPLGFVFENVEGILQHGIIDRLKGELEPLGYKIKSDLLIAANYGVPQKRRRVIVVGCLGVEPKLPDPTHSKDKSDGTKPWVTVAEAFLNLDKKDFQRPDCYGMKHSAEMKRRMKYVKPGGNFRDVPDKILPNCWTNGKHQGQDTFGRLKLEEPSITIRTCGYNPTKGRYIHPLEDRGLNTLEMAALQSFPKEYIFAGGLKSVGEQIGNAVPPLFGKAIGEALKPCLVEAKNLRRS